MKIQNLGYAALFLISMASGAKAQYYGVGPGYGAVAPAPLAPAPVMSASPMGLPGATYDPAVMPASAMSSCDDYGSLPGADCGCGPGLGGCGSGGACGGACGIPGCGLGAGGCGPAGCGGLLGGGLGSLSGSLASLTGGAFGPQGGPLGPYGTGECCLPRWFDIHTEYMFLQRDDAGRNIDFTSNLANGDRVLSTSDLDFDEESGFRITGAYIVGPSTNIEATYFGTFNWSDSAVAVSDNLELFSVYSNFGLNPIGGFPETDAAFRHRIAYSSALDNGEINLRRRWVSANCLFQGSWLVGARYVSLIEDFEYQTQTDVASLQSLTNTENDLIGAQLGGELFMCITSRLKIGVEGEAGLYGIRAKQHTTVTTTTGVSLDERMKDDDVAFVGELGAMAVYRLTPRATLRGGYQFLMLDGVALATENFNTASPFSIRNAVMNDNGEAVYSGATAGIEWTW